MTRREWLAASGLIVAAGCGRKKGTGFPGYAMIATSGDSSLTAVDLTAFRLKKTIPLAAPPTAVIPSRTPGWSYVLTPSIGTVYLIDENLRPFAKKQITDRLSELRLTPDGKRLVAISTDARQLFELDPADLHVLRRVQLNEKPTDLDISIDGAVAIASAESGTVELIDLVTGSRQRAHIDGTLGALRFRQDGKLLLIANMKDRSLTVLKSPSLEAMADLQLAMAPENLCFKPDGGQLFVSGHGMDAVAIVFPYDTLEVEQTVLAGRDPGAMACSNDPSYLFVGNASGSDVSILNVSTRKAIGVVEVGQRPGYIAITPDDQYALVLNQESGDMSVIRISAIRINRGKTGAALFTMLPVGNSPVHAAVVTRLPG
jgi:YVTN family beta-propeller protein